MKTQEARDMTQDELVTRERELTDELFHLRLRRATSQLPNPMKVRTTKRKSEIHSPHLPARSKRRRFDLCPGTGVRGRRAVGCPGR